MIYRYLSVGFRPAPLEDVLNPEFAAAQSAELRIALAAPEMLALLREAIHRGPIGGENWAFRARELVESIDR